MNAVVANNAITADARNVSSAGAFKATSADGLTGLLRGAFYRKFLTSRTSKVMI